MNFICAICGSTKAQTQLVIPDYQIVKCGGCSTLQLWPQPSAATLQSFYDLPYYTRHLDTWFSRLFMRWWHRWEIKRVRFLRTLQPLGRFLDVGCGAGELLADMADAGYEAYGTEVSPAAWQTMPVEIHSRVRIGKLEHCHFPADFFNLIMLSDVLEHTYHPPQTLQAVARILRRDGRVVVSVPNWDDPDARIFPRQYWHNIDAPRHLWHFTAATLPQLAQRAGLKVVGTMRLGWIELFEAPLSLVHAWEKWLRSVGIEPALTRGLTWLGAPFLIPLTLVIRVASPHPRQLRLVFTKI